MNRRDFLKYGSSGLAGLALGGLTRTPLFRIGNVFAASAASPTAWSFGVLGDTQWTRHDAHGNSIDPSGLNPNNVPVSIINQVDQQFAKLGVKFVLQVGDLTDCGTTAGIQTRALAAQTNLYPYNIGFFPVRGNHETYGPSYGDNNNFGIPAIQANFPQTQGQGTTWGAFNFNSSPLSPWLNGISYSFDFDGAGQGNSARVLMLDAWTTPDNGNGVNSPDGYAYGWTVNDQQAWISRQLDKVTRGTEHAFVFTHQPLIAEDHQDTIFNGYTNANLPWQNAFMASMYNNNVKYFISGHDHVHQRSIITSPDGLSKVQELICASCSSKFYTPKSVTDPGWYGQKVRETSLSQELWTVGFYVFTVDGPLVTVDYYSDSNGTWLSDSSYPTGPSGQGTLVTPTFNFVKKETWGYSLNGAEFKVIEGSSSNPATQVSFLNTTATVRKSSTAADYSGRSLTKAVDAYYAARSTVSNADAISDNLTLIGGVMDCAAAPTDAFVLTMSYDPSVTMTRNLINQGRMIAVNTTDADGNWVNAVDLNIGGTKRFVYGPWNKAYPLGTYGVDPGTHTAWAVVNHTSDYAVIKTGR